jgi:hypothetical protein
MKNGLTRDDLTHIDKKTLLSSLGEVNDAEIIILKFHTLIGKRQRDFAERHRESLASESAMMGSGRDVIDRATIRDSYTQNLARLGLLLPKYQTAKKGELPDFDRRTGTLRSTGYEVTALGRLLLRYLDIADSDW